MNHLHNGAGGQTEKSSNKQGKGIRKRLKEYIESVSIDLWGYESIINSSVVKYASTLALQYEVGIDQVIVRITKPKGLRVFLHINGSLIKELTVIEMVEFFMGYQPDQGLQSKVIVHVSAFIEDYKAQKCSKNGKIQLLISAREDQTAMLKSFDDQVFLECIPMKTLIQFFKS